ncbi:MAG: hypothetical protein JRF64_09505, partial [Deltaproteobacteria bacterium]|nr:hypothetical protein [Deltaproteobacteria bacterium]
ILCQGNPKLYNPYGIIPISQKKHPHVKFQWADQFAKWLTSQKAQSLIARYRIEGHHVKFQWADQFAKWLTSQKAQSLIASYRIEGQQAFFPDAIPDAK